MSKTTPFPQENLKNTTFWTRQGDRLFSLGVGWAHRHHEIIRAHGRLVLGHGPGPDDIWGSEIAGQVRDFLAEMKEANYAGSVLLSRMNGRRDPPVRGYGIGSVIFGKQILRQTYYEHSGQQGEWVPVTDDPYMDRPPKYVPGWQSHELKRLYMSRYITGTTRPHNVFIGQDGYPWLDVNKKVFRPGYARRRQEEKPNFAVRLPYKVFPLRTYGASFEPGSFLGRRWAVAGADNWRNNNALATSQHQTVESTLDDYRRRAHNANR